MVTTGSIFFYRFRSGSERNLINLTLRKLKIEQILPQPPCPRWWEKRASKTTEALVSLPIFDGFFNFKARKMLRIDFNQRFLDHRSILVYVKKLGAVTETEFTKLFEDISQLRAVKLPNGRTVHLRYARHISEEFIDWGSFHMHKKLLGILSVARLLDDNISTLKTAHENLKTWVGNTALHSRCFILGCGNTSEENRDREFVFLNKDNIMKEIERQVADYALALFLVLEGKRMDKSLEKPEKFAFLRSPLDGEMSADADSRLVGNTRGGGVIKGVWHECTEI